MPIRASYLALLGAFALAGCPGPATCADGRPVPPGGCGGIVLPDAGPDVGVPPDGSTTDTGGADTRIDTGTTTPSCGTTGAVGGHCRGGSMGGTCASGFMCQPEFLTRTTMEPLTIRNAFLIEQGYMLDPVTGFYQEVPTAMADPMDDVPLPVASGSICTNICDASAMMDSCGTCASCSTDIGTVGILATWLFYAVADRPFDDATGWCRANCTFDPNTAGAECPGTTSPTENDAFTCSPGSNICVEGCISDNECRFAFETTREGLYVSVVDDTSPVTCNATTHRCDWTTTATETTGDVCDSNSDCTSDIGLCLNGGTCGEYGCGTAPDTMSDMSCDGGRGVCLGNGGNNGSICIEGCNTAATCNPGNACVPFTGGATVGGFVGYCLGICDTAATDPDGSGPMTPADDGLIVCGAGYQCDNGTVTATNLDPNGDCRVPCMATSDCTDRTPDEGNFCEIDTTSGGTYGFCRWLDQVCSYQDLSADCFGTQVCDLLQFEGNLGLCVDPCATDADCAMGDRCVTTSGRNVCRTPCMTGGTPCPMGEICQGAAGSQFCEQATTMM